ncbi:MAG: nucleoid-associated protein [Firmicutes bacterium]|nr:nucleoid-associated protein [Bacillota bacterium]
MDIIIKRAILHILDFQSNMTVISNQWLDLSDPAMLDFVVKHVENSMKDSGRHRGEFQPQSRFSQMVHQYLNQELDLISLSSTAATMLHDEIIQSDSLDSMDVMMVEFVRSEEQYLGLLCFQNKMGYVHQVFNGDDGVRNEIMRHYAILPNTSQKISSFAFIKLSDLKITFQDKKRTINGEQVYALPERVLQCTWQHSSRETVKMVNKIATKVAEEHGANSTMAVSRAKSYIAENAETSDLLSPMDMGREVFAESSVMQNEFRIQLQEAGLDRPMPVDRPYAHKVGKSHKIKTDTGIEITIPVDYFGNEHYVEFINNPDGTLSIALKNIAKITNRQ